LFSGRCAAAIAISPSVASDARDCIGSTSIRTILNAVDLRRFCPHGEHVDLDAMAGLPRAAGRPLRVGLVATFAKWKGHEIFLRALARPELRDLDIRGYVVGGPIYETGNGQHSLEAMRAMARELGIEARVGFTGFVDDVPSAMRSLDIVVHASTAPEPFGLVIAEAMACGRPVIASLSGGAADLFTNGHDAVGLPPGDASELAGAILGLARDPIGRVRLGWAARVTAESRFNRARLGPQLSECYRELICESSISTAAISTAA
jgi:glycosyltransferase involved in cell wall biosynthesis